MTPTSWTEYFPSTRSGQGVLKYFSCYLNGSSVILRPLAYVQSLHAHGLGWLPKP